MAEAVIEREISEAPQQSAALLFYRENRGSIHAVASFVIVAVIWQVTASMASSLIIAPLQDIWASFLKLLNFPNVFDEKSGKLWLHFQTSFRAFAIGYAMAAVVGVVLGIAIAVNDYVREFLDPLISALYSTPTIALAPLFILIFGIDIPSKVAVVFLLVIFPIVINTATGIRTTDRVFIEAARSFCANRWQIFGKVLIPSALPFIVAGLRLGVGRGLVAVVVGELFGARAGLGFLILTSSQVFDTASLFVGVFILAGLGILSVVILQTIERRMAPWREFELK